MFIFFLARQHTTRHTCGVMKTHITHSTKAALVMLAEVLAVFAIFSLGILILAL
jgi:hypothetical protein